MSTFTKNSVTLKGAVAIAALMAGGTLEFTRIAVGDGNIPEGQTALTMTDLSHHLFDVDINEVYSDSESQATVIGIFNNSQTETGFYYRELGLFAKDPATGAEILFCYGNAGDEAEWISPAGSESVIEKEVHIVTLVGNATEVKATLKSGIYLSQEQAKLKADLDATAAEGGRVVPEQMRFDETQTIYVDAAASATGADGSEAKPFKTFAAALGAFYAGARVVLIKAKAGTYDEAITVQNAPGTLFHFSRNGEGTVSVKSLTAIFTQVYVGDFTITGGMEGNAVTFSNVSNFAMQRVNVGGTSDTSGIASYNSKGFLETVAINGCGTAFEARDSSQVALRGVSGSGNSVGVASFESVVTVAELTMTATTLYVTGNGGAINTDGALSTYPSSQGHLYSLGGFATSAELRTRLAQEFGKLKEGDFKAFRFWNNIIGNFGTFISSQTMHVSLHKTSNDGGGYGIAHFYAHRDDGAAYMQFVNGGFTTETPIPLAKWQIINDATANVGDLTTGIYTIQSGSNGTAGVPTAQNGTLICDRNVGVPYQIYITDYENVMYKRIFADGAWQAWSRFPGIATTSEYGLIRLASESDVLQETDQTVMDVPLAYELNDFRRMNKAYQVGDKVNCAFRFEYFLECTQAGTTSGESLDTRNVTHGQEINDGTAKWTVRTHVKSVNNAVPDANGDIAIKSLPVTVIQSNTDLNDITEFGEYVCVDNLVSTTLTNCPIQEAFTLTVRKGCNIQQELRHYTGAQGVWIRNYNNWQGLWTQWKKQGSDNDAIKQAVLNIFFPVGSVYMSANTNFDPNTSWGGTWVKIENRVLLGSGTRVVGATGGSETVTLTVQQMPTHSHSRGSMEISGVINQMAHGNNVSLATSGAFSHTVNIESGNANGVGKTNRVVLKASNLWNGWTSDHGNSQPHDNMMPYEVVNVWKRTA